MDPLLHHIAEITRNRDHELLEVAVISALYQLTNAAQARSLEIIQVRDELFVQEKVWIHHGKAVSVADQQLDAEEERMPLSCYPALVECIKLKKTAAEEITDSGSHILWLPVWLNDKINGCIHLESPMPYSTDTNTVIRGVLQVYSNYQNLIDYSERDSLTGLLNRKTFDEKFARMACTVAARERHQLDDHTERRLNDEPKSHWLAVVDIDHFKQVNDKFGHLYGDEVLILVANMLKTSFRSQDRVFRFGGEEFVILLRSVTLESARKALERFRQTVGRHDFPQVGNVTLSIGFVSITTETPVVILGHADQALYYAKEHGRNQVQFYDELLASGQLSQTEVANDAVEFFDFS